MNIIKKIIFSLTLLIASNVVISQYQPTWDSLDKHPLPQWYDDAKIGIFIHWGVFSVPSFDNEWFWENWKNPNRSGHQKYVDFMNKNYPPNWTYADFGPQFTAEFYEPDKWADLFKASGARYVVLTSKHHEGFTMWPSKYSWNWNAMDVGAKRDLLGDLAKSIRNRTDLHFGLYHSLYEWFNPLYNYDLAHNTTLFVDQKTMPELYEIVNTYLPEIIWSDGSYGSDDYWKSKEFIAWLYNESPVKDKVVVNDRWGGNSSCNHGDFYNCKDRYNPKTLVKHKWENCFTLDKHSWGYRREAVFSDYLTIYEILTTIAETVSCYGNVLINVGPTHEGRIVPIMEERLRQLGEWLKINGEAIYGSTFWTHQNDTVTPGVWFTSKPKETGAPFYAIVLNWPNNGELNLGAVNLVDSSVVRMLGYNTANLEWKNSTQGIVVQFPQITTNLQIITSIHWVAVLKFIK